MVPVKSLRGAKAGVAPITAHALVGGPSGKQTVAKSARLTIRSDEAARRLIADTDGAARRAREMAEINRLI